MRKKLKLKTEEPIGRKALENPKSRNCNLGISLGKTYFSKENVEAYMRFGVEHFDKVLIWIADYPERWNYMALKGINEEEATRRVLKQGQQEISKFSKLVRKLEQEGVERGRITLSDFLSLTRNSDFETVLSRVYQEYNDNPIFMKDMRKWLQRNIGGRFKDRNVKSSSLEQAVDTAMNYLIEETAMMIYLSNIHNDKFVDIYPAPYSDIICMKALNERRYPELWKDLGLEEGYGYIDARIKRPINETIGEWLGNKLGKSPEQRRGSRERISYSIEQASFISKLAIATTLMFAPYIAYIASDLATTKSKDVIVVDRENYRVIERTSGITEIYLESHVGATWYDYDSNGDLDCIEIFYPRFPPIREKSPALLESVNKIYEKIRMIKENEFRK